MYLREPGWVPLAVRLRGSCEVRPLTVRIWFGCLNASIRILAFPFGMFFNEQIEDMMTKVSFTCDKWNHLFPL